MYLTGHRWQVSSIVGVGLKPETHVSEPDAKVGVSNVFYQWRYTAMALRFLSGLLRRDAASSPALLAFLFKNITSPQTNVRHAAQKYVRMYLFIFYPNVGQGIDTAVGVYENQELLQKW